MNQEVQEKESVSAEQPATPDSALQSIEDMQAALEAILFAAGYPVPYKKIGILKVRQEEFPKNTLRKIMRFKLDMSID